MLVMSSKLVVVTISPAGISLVCDGDLLELTCSLTDPGSSLLVWSFVPAITSMDLYRAIDDNSVSDEICVINSTLFTFSRISARGHLPLVSRLIIDSLTTGLNGTVINYCTDVTTMETASATVYVIKFNGQGVLAYDSHAILKHPIL